MDNLCSFQLSQNLICTLCRKCASDQAMSTLQFRDDLKALQFTKKKLLKLRDDVVGRIGIVERKQMKQLLEQIQEWVRTLKVKKLIEVEELMRDISEEAESCSNGGFCFNCKSSSHMFARRITELLEDLITLGKEGLNFREETKKALIELVLERPGDLLPGQREKLEEVWGCLMEDQVETIGLYGIGGIGKTTLLTQIHKNLVPLDFDALIWVVSSGGIEEVQANISKKLGLFNEKWKKKSIGERAAMIFIALSRKKFALLLDDTRQSLDLSAVGVPFPLKKNGSKIIFTTSKQNVTREMKAEIIITVDPLTSCDAWELFRRNVGEEALNPEIPRCAQLLALACNGSPLLLINIARALACKKTLNQLEQYAHILLTSSTRTIEDVGVEVHLLLFIYNSLPDDRVRSCFLYWVLFPEGFKISKDDLINYWMCEDFWGKNDNGARAYERGYNVIDTLVSAHLLEYEGKYVKMHDVVRHMALWLLPNSNMLSKHCYVQAGVELMEKRKSSKWSRVRRISLMKNSIRNLTKVHVCPELTTLFLCQNPLVTIIEGFFQYMQALTVLDLSNSSILELPLEISKLASLQYLNLSRTCIEQLPIQMQMLEKLKYLNLEHNDLLRTIPRQVISSLLKLEVLRMFNCSFSLVEDEDNFLSCCNMHVEELQHLQYLNVLSITISSATALRNFFSMSKLHSFTRALSLKCLWGTRSLDLSPLSKMELLDVLEFYRNDHLEELNVDFFMEEKKIQGSNDLHKSGMLRERSFCSLKELGVANCNHLRELTWLVVAPNLTVLKVTGCRDMKEIIGIQKLGKILHSSSEDLNLFAKLEVLVLDDLPDLKSIYWNPLPLPCLENITVIDCPMLKKLPLDSNSTKGPGFSITATEHWWENVEWEDDDTRAVFLRRFVETDTDDWD